MPKEWNDFYKSHGRFHLEPHEAFNKLVNKLNQDKVETVLDLGSGSGRHLVALAEKGFAVQGVDFSPAAVDIAQKWLMEKGLSGRVSIADLHEEIKTYPEGSFDSVIAVDSINHQTKEDFKASLVEINRLLKTNGIFFLVVPSKKSPIEDINEEQLFFEKTELNDLLEETFIVDEFYQDTDRNFVIFAKEK